MEKDYKQKLRNFTFEVIDLFLGIPESIVYSFDRKEFYRALQGMPSDNVLGTDILHFRSEGLIGC